MLFRVVFKRVPGCFVGIACFPGFFIGFIEPTGRMVPYGLAGCI